MEPISLSHCLGVRDLTGFVCQDLAESGQDVTAAKRPQTQEAAKGKLRKEGHGFEASLGFIAGACLKKESDPEKVC